MNLTASIPVNTTPVDEDLVEQAQPGHGVPSQDPATAAQFPLDPAEAQREANSVLTGGGLVAGAASGAAIGAAVAGPVGVVVGGSLGAIVGALGAAAAGTLVNPEDSSNGGSQPTAQVNTVNAASADDI